MCQILAAKIFSTEETTEGGRKREGGGREGGREESTEKRRKRERGRGRNLRVAEAAMGFTPAAAAAKLGVSFCAAYPPPCTFIFASTLAAATLAGAARHPIREREGGKREE